MPKRIPVTAVHVYRNGKEFVPPIGQAFDFTAEELADINAVNPDAVRKPVNEGTDEPVKEATKAPAAAATGTAKVKGATAGADAL